MAAVRSSNRLFALGRWSALQQHALLPCGGSNGVSRRYCSGDIKWLKTTDTAHMKRGKGGRSSFSGNICTIFGATGFMGRHIANRLGKIGTQIIIPYRCDFYDARHLKLAGDLGQVLFSPFHLTDEESIHKAVKHSNIVINLIGRDWPTNNFTLQQVHVEGAARIARISKEAGVDRFIHVSALNCDRDYEGFVIPGGSPFLEAKGAGELAVREEFPEATIIRPSDVYGQGDRFLRYYSGNFRSESYGIGLPKGGRDIFKQPVYVFDVAQGIVNASIKDMGAEGQTYQAVGPRRYELREMVEWLMRVLRRGPDMYVYCEVKDIKWYKWPVIKAMFSEMLPSWPINSMTVEKLERESVTDVINKQLPTLEDLGINLTKIEDKAEWELKPFRAHEYFVENIGDFDPPAPPKFVQQN